MDTLIVWWRDTRGKVAVTLLILWIGAVITRFSWTALVYPAASVVICVVLDILLVKVRFGRDIFSLSSIVTGFLIGLILDPQAGVLAIVGACIVACVSKQYLSRGSHRHICNPAAIGLVTSWLLFGGTISWWGVAWGYIPIVIILIGMMIALHQLHRLWMPALFLVVYFLSILLYSSPVAAVRLTIDGTVFLFAFVMLPEPMTSLLFGKWRYTWGIFVGLLILVANVIRIPLPDPLLVPLLAANAFGFFFVRSKYLSGTA